MEQYQKYIDDVLSGKLLVCEHVRNAVLRQVKDLDRQSTPDFPYIFDEEEAQRWISFIGILRHTSGEWKGKLFQIQDFQAFRWAVIFGWQRADGKGRRFRRAFVEVARKQGKTEEAAAIGSGGMLIDGEQTAQIYSAATTRQQARIVFDAAKIMMRELRNDSEAIAAAVDILSHRILFRETDSFITALSADAWTLDGLSPHMAIIDEFHAHPNNEVLKVIETGQGARRSPLSYIITTAGFNFSSPWYSMRENAIDILRGVKVDETFFAIIYTLDKDDDWKDKTKWAKANPQIGITPTWEFMDSEFTKALNEGGRSEVEFKTKNLNLPVGVSEVWIQDELWQKCGGEIDLESLRGRPCYVGIDFASVCDFTALVLLFPGRETDGEDKEPHILVPYFWIPETVLEMRGRDLPDLYKWSHRVTDNGRSMPGKVNVTPTNFTDYEYIIKEVAAINEMFDIKVLGYDPANAYQTIIRLDEAGINTDKFSQGIMNMSAPSKEFERLVRMGMINHGNNPVLRWMLSCCMPYYDSNENLKVQKLKESRTAKIDGIVASIIAVGEMCKNPIPDVYSKVDLFLI